MLSKLGVDDAIDAVGVHLGAGIWGVIAVPFFNFNTGNSLLYSGTTDVAWYAPDPQPALPPTRPAQLGGTCPCALSTPPRKAPRRCPCGGCRTAGLSCPLQNVSQLGCTDIVVHTLPPGDVAHTHTPSIHPSSIHSFIHLCMLGSARLVFVQH